MFAMPNDIRSNFVKQKIFFLPPPLLNQLYLHMTTLTETIVFFIYFTYIFQCTYFVFSHFHSVGASPCSKELFIAKETSLLFNLLCDGIKPFFQHILNIIEEISSD